MKKMIAFLIIFAVLAAATISLCLAYANDASNVSPERQEAEPSGSVPPAAEEPAEPNADADAGSDESQEKGMQYIDEPYIYPILPGTDEWKQLTVEERFKACEVDEELLEKMSTKALVETVCTHPFLSSARAFGSFKSVLQVLSANKYVKILEARKDKMEWLEEFAAREKERTEFTEIKYYNADMLIEYFSADPDAKAGPFQYGPSSYVDITRLQDDLPANLRSYFLPKGSLSDGAPLSSVDITLLQDAGLADSL